jgi:hypothetical protein
MKRERVICCQNFNCQNSKAWCKKISFDKMSLMVVVFYLLIAWKSRLGLKEKNFVGLI